MPAKKSKAQYKVIDGRQRVVIERLVPQVDDGRYPIKRTLGETVMVEADTLYNIVDDSGYGEHTLELIIESPGVRLFTFTFG